MRRILGCVLLLILSQTAASAVDLTRRDLYIREGFDLAWTTEFKPEGWLRIPGEEDGTRPVRLSELSAGEKRTFFSIADHGIKTYTFVTDFPMSNEDLAGTKVYALYLAQIGMNWEVYLNGKLLRSEMPPAPPGKIRNRTMRGVIIPIDSRLLKAGPNIIAYHITGDPTFEDTGFYRSRPYTIDTIQNIEGLRYDPIMIVLLSLYGAVSIFHFVLFLRTPRERFNLYYSLLTATLFFYYSLRTNSIFDIITDSSAIFLLDVSSVILIVPFGASFLDSLFFYQVTRFTKGLWAFSLLMIALLFPFPLPFARDVLYIWQASLPVSLFYILYIIGGQFLTKTREYETIYKLTPFRAGLRALLRSPPGNLLLGGFIVTGCALVEVIDSVTEARGVNAVVYGLFCFVGGVAAILANRIIEVHRKVDLLNRDLSDKLQEIQKTSGMLRNSEEKYRQIIEGSSDMIFTLDDDLRFTSVNRALHRDLGFPEEEVLGSRFFDLLYQGELESGLAVNLVHRRFEEFKRNGKTLGMKIQLKSKYTQEPREFSARFERVQVDDGIQILGKATLVLEDSLLRYFIKERQKYVIGNYLISAEELSQRLVRNVEKYLDPSRVTALRIGLREILINAIEHGNLAITYDEKTRELTTGNYLEFIQARQLDPRFRDRKVVIEYELNTLFVQYTITDEGEGFDWQKLKAEEDIHQQDSHGRGIAVTENAFDELIYSGKGNQVQLIKHFRR